MNKLDLTKPLQTRSGKPVTLLYTEGRGNYPVGGYVDAQEAPETWTKEGLFYIEGRNNNPLDLVNVPVKHRRELWMNMYPARENDDVASIGWAKQLKAETSARADVLARVKVVVEYTEGEGL